MDSFWTFARRMRRHTGLLIAALVMAAVSAFNMGVGLLAMVPALETILEGSGKQSDELLIKARELDARVGGWLPDGLIEMIPTDRFHAVIGVVVAVALLTVFGAVANFLHAFLSLTVITRTIADVRREAFRAAIHLPIRTVLETGTADAVSRIVYDTGTLGRGFLALLSKGVAQVTKGIAGLAAAFVMDWRLAAVSILVAPVLAIIIRKLGKRIRRASKKALQSQAVLYQRASEVLSGLRVVRVYGRERAESGRFHRANKDVIRQELRVRTARALSSPLVDTITIFVIGGFSLIAAKAIIDNELSPASFLSVLFALAVAGASLKPLTGIINDIQQASAAAERVGALLALDGEPGHGRDRPRLAAHAESVALEAVTFTYPGGELPALRAVSVEVAHGETVAFVGPNGSGKTTLLSLIPRLFDPDNGRVLIDGTDIRDVSVRSLRRQIGVVTQETVLFKGTIASNIAYGIDGATDDQIRDAARRARALEFIEAKPGGFEALVGEDGSGLSGGQRQRVAIARAILRDPRLLILDEATSMIDAESESKITEALADFGRDRTCLVVAHRLSTVINADRIVVLDGGELVDVGTHDELLGRCAVYRTIASHQLVG